MQYAKASRRTWSEAFRVAARNTCPVVYATHKTAAVPHTDGLFVRVGIEVLDEHNRSGGLRSSSDRGRSTPSPPSLVSHPAEQRLIVTTSLYGDILSDVAGATAGSVAIVAGANVGEGVAVFEAAHGVARRHAGTDSANPLGLVLSVVMLLDHAGEAASAGRWRAPSSGPRRRHRPADLHPARVVEAAS